MLGWGFRLLCFFSFNHVLPCRSKDHLNPLYVKPTDLDDVDKGAATPNGQSAPPISEAGGESGAEPVSNGTE